MRDDDFISLTPRQPHREAPSGAAHMDTTAARDVRRRTAYPLNYIALDTYPSSHYIRARLPRLFSISVICYPAYRPRPRA